MVILSAGVFAQDTSMVDIDDFMAKQEVRKESGPSAAMNAFYLEIGGNALFISLNYSRLHYNTALNAG